MQHYKEQNKNEKKIILILAVVLFASCGKQETKTDMDTVQVLICVYGRGWYQEWGKPAIELHKGVVVEIPEACCVNSN